MSKADRHASIALEKGWGWIADILDAILAMLGGLEQLRCKGVSHNLRLHALNMLRRAEAMTRRMLVMAAEHVVWAPLRANKGNPQLSDAAAVSTQQRASVRGFAMLEPWPLCADGRLPGSGVFLRPRIRTFDEPSPPPAQESGDGLFNRLVELHKLLDAPDPYIRRMARWLAKRKPRQRRTPFRLGRPLGFQQKSIRSLHGCGACNYLADLHVFATESLERMRRQPP